MKSQVHNYLRAYRKRAGLTQQELARLLGVPSGEEVCRLERHVRHPNLNVAFACQALFGVPAHELFPNFYTKVEQQTKQRAQGFAHVLKKQNDPICEYKLGCLNIMNTRHVEPADSS